MYRETLKQDEIEFFHENGYLLVKSVVPPKILELMRAATSELQDHYQKYRDEPKVFYTSPDIKNFDDMMNGSAGQGGSSERMLWRVDELEERMPAVGNLKKLRFVHNAMQQLLGNDIIQYNESFVTKPPRIGMPVHWHQDPSFKVKVVPAPISTCDIYLDKADEENGCIWVVPGSHRNGVISNEQIEAWTHENGFQIPGAVPVRVEPGDVAFHDNGCLHGSQANPSDRQRRIVYLAFQTLAQARASGEYTQEFIDEKLESFNEYRKQAFGG